MSTAEQPATQDPVFEEINAAYSRVFRPQRLSVGLVVPIETYANGPVPTMQQHIERVQLAESLGFSAVWLRDVPFNVPSFGDAGQTYDPFVYLGALATQTTSIALGVASIILPVRHPAHVAKAAATVDVLSNGRLLLGIASGDRPEEYPALNLPYQQRGEWFRDSVDYIRAMAGDNNPFQNRFGSVGGGIDMLPKPVGKKLPLLVTGSSQQANEWIATHGDGWMTYPRPLGAQSQLIAEYRSRVAAAGYADKPVMEPLYIDLVDQANAAPTPIHLGIRTGVNHLRQYLLTRKRIGVNHVALNLRFNGGNTESTLTTLAKEILPEFSH